MDHECEEQQYSPLVFTSLQGKVFQVDLDEIPQLSPKHRRTESVKSLLELRSSSLPDANGNVVKDEQGLEVGIGGLDGSGAESENKDAFGTSTVRPPQISMQAKFGWSTTNMASWWTPKVSCSRDMKDITQIMRLFQKVYHHDVSGNCYYLLSAIHLWILVNVCLFRTRMIDVEQADWESPIDHENNMLAGAGKISSWEYEPEICMKNPPSATPEEKRTATVCQDPPRYAPSTPPLLPLTLAQVGCSDGSWCFQLKNAHPDWVIDGIDDTDHWTCMNKDTDLRHGCIDQSLKQVLT
ncbi:hypothetical protein CJF32_00004579 [Rutstroemia sp. NJR-2017a WRK4]|nr:hypothetical protein CJF32_00004579 [Rutstroemia sp. NJR-2017a WRK4]